MSTPDKSTTSPALKEAPSRWFAAGLLLLVVLALGNIRLLLGSAAPQWDAVDFFGPQFALVGDQARSGHLLKWDPWVGAGGPDLAEPELGTTSPILIAASFLSINPQEGYVAYWMAVWAFGGIGMLLLTRHLRCPAWGGAIAALGFVASGFYTGHAEHMSSIYSVSFLPWILWRLDAGIQYRHWWCGVQAGALYGLSALGGYPAFTIMTPGFLFLWTLGRVLCRDSGSANENRRSTPVFAAVVLILTIGVGFVIFGPPYAGILVNTHGYCDRIGVRLRERSISSNRLPAGAMATFASPYLALLNFPPKAVWPETDVSMTSIYTGVASLVFALFALRRRSGWRWWLVLMVGFFACCALGSQLPLRGWLYDFVPPTRYFRNPALFRAYVILVIGILAALAARDLAEETLFEADRVRLWLIAIFLACSSVVCFCGVVRIAPKSMPELPGGIVHLIVVWFGLAVLAYAIKKRYLSIGRFLRSVALLAAFDAVGNLYISRPILYSSGTVPWWHEMNAHHDRTVNLSSTGLARVLHPPDVLGSYPNNRNLLLKTPVFDSYMPLSNRFQHEMAGDPVLSQMAIGAGRLWFSSVVALRAPDDASLKRFRERIHDLAGQPILLVHSPEQMIALSPADAPEFTRKDSMEPLNVPPCIPAPVSDVLYNTDSLSFRYAAPREGYLLVTDRWASGWEVMVNGRRRPVLGGNFIFRAVQVEAGVNIIQFQYNPQPFWPLLVVSWGTLLLIAAWECRRLLLGSKETLRRLIAEWPATRHGIVSALSRGWDHALQTVGSWHAVVRVPTSEPSPLRARWQVRETSQVVGKCPGDDARQLGEPSIDWLASPRVWAFLVVLTAFIVLSFNRFSEFAWSELRLDRVSQADNIGIPARGYLNSRLPHASPIGCVSANPAWPDACEFLWYSMLPYYTKPTPPSVEPTHRYVIFVGDPRAAETLESQASRIRNYQIEAPLTTEAVLLVRRNP